MSENKFWEDLKAKKDSLENTTDNSPYAKENLTGLTSSSIRQAGPLKGHLKDLNEEVGLDLFADSRTWEDVGYQNQSMLDLATNTFFGTIVNTAAGIVEGVASNDLKGIYDTALGNTEQHYGNILHDFAKELMEYSDENFHIYNNPEGSIFSFDYMGKQLQSLGYSTGIIAEMFGEQALLAAATRGAGNMASSGALVNRYRKATKLLSSPAVFGSYQGLKESYLNALQTGEETYKKFKDIGFDEESAKRKANEAATLGFRMEALPLMAMNSLQFAAIGKYNPFKNQQPNLGYSGGLETLSERAFKNIKSPKIKRLADYGVNIGAEAIEEGIQTGISKEAQYQVGLAENVVGKKDIEDRLFDDHELRDSMIGGALGGGMFRLIGKRFNELIGDTKGQQEKQEEYDAFIDKTARRVYEDTDDLKAAFEKDDQDQIDVIRKRMQRNNVFEALSFDLLNQDEKAFNTYLSTLELELDRLDIYTPEETEKYLGHTPEDAEFIRANFPIYIEDAKNIREKLINNLENIDDYNVAIQLTHNEKTLEELIDLEQNSGTKYQAMLSENKPYNKLSDGGKNKFNLLVEQASLVLKAKQNSITKDQKNRLTEVQNELSEIPELSTSDNNLLKSINHENFVREKLNTLELQEYQNFVADKVDYWKNPKNQEKEIVRRAKRKIEKAQSTGELKRAKEDLEKQDVLTEETKEVINNKIEKSRINDIDNIGVIDSPFGGIVTPKDEDFNVIRGQKAKKLSDTITDITDPASPNTTVEDHDGLFAPLELVNYSNEALNKIKVAVEDYYESLKSDLNKEPTFQEFVRDFIRHNNKEVTDNIYNALVEGWKANNYKEVDFNKAYNEIFRDRKIISSDIIDIAKDMVGSPTVKKEVVEQNNTTVEEVTAEKAPIVEMDNNSNQPLLRDTNAYRTVSPELKAAYLSVPYKREIIEQDGVKTVVDVDVSEDLNNSEYLNSNKLLDPELFNAGTELNISIPSNYEEIKVATWEDDITKGPAMTFGQWVRQNNIEEGSQEWIEKVPMIAYDQDGEGVFFVHDTQWYNPVNIGNKENPVKQSEIIDAAKEELRSIRKDVAENQSLKIEITEKRPGTWKTLSDSQEAITLNSANPDIQLAIATDKGDLKLNGAEDFENDARTLINTKKDSFKRGNVYDIRRASNKDEYIAFEVLREKINTDTVKTLEWAIKTYLFQADKQGLASDPAKIKNIQQQVLQASGFDLTDVEDFEKFLNLHIPLVKGKFSGTQDIYNKVEGHKNIPVGTPYASIQSGSLVFGIKGERMSENHNVLYIHPNKVNDPNGAQQADSMINKFGRMLGSFTQHISKDGLEQDYTVVSIDEDGSVLPVKNYRDYLKDNLKTNVKSFNIGTKESPNYITNIQPVIHFKKAKDSFETFVDTGKVSEEVVETIANKIEAGEVLTMKEEAMRQEASEAVENKLNEKVVSEITPKENVVTDTTVETIKEYNTGVEDLTILQNFQLVDYLFNELSINIDFKYKTSVNKKQLLKEVRESYLNIVKPRKEHNEKVLANLKEVYANTPTEALQGEINRIEQEINYYNTVENNWKSFQDQALKKLYKYTGIKETKVQEDTVEFNVEPEGKEKNYSKTSLEENGKTTASYRLKRFFAGIKKVDASGKVKKGFLGVPTYVGFDDVHKVVEQVVSSPFEVDSDFDLMIARLEENTESIKWLKQLVNELKDANDQIKNEFVYNYARHTLSMKLMMFSKNRDNTYTLKTYDTNANEITRVIRRQWDSNLKQTPLTYVEDGSYSANKERAKFLLGKFNEWSKVKDKKTIPNAELSDWLADFGITIADETLDELKNKKTEYITNTGKSTISFNEMFEKTSNTAGIFGLLADYLDTISTREDTSYEDNQMNHPFNNANNVLKTLSKIESKYSLFATTNSFRDGNKSIYGFTPTKYSSDAVKKLKFDQSYRDQLLNKSFNKHSFILNLLNEDESFQNKFYLDHIGITAMKELNKRVAGDNNSITSLSDTDHELTKLGLFQDLEQGSVSKSLGEQKSIDLRMARMFLPTMSDKSQMLDLYTAVLSLKNKHFIFNEDETFSLTEDVKEFLYTQMVKPELERITTFNSTVKKTDIKGYDLAAQLFLFIPELNNLYDDATNERVISLMNTNPTVYNMEWFENTLKNKSKNIIGEMISKQVKDKIDFWETSGIIEVTKEGAKIPTFLNDGYVSKFKGDSTRKVTLAAADYVINSLVANANNYMVLAGDIALYSQNKIAKYFQDNNPALPKEQYGNEAYSTIVKDIISTNVGKRLALMLAPGNKLANSKNATYKQVFLEDFIDITSNVESLVTLFYGAEEGKKAKSKFEEYNNTSSSEGRKRIAKSLSESYEEIADYFDIEATDAQEYTTLSEHVDVLWGQGRLTDSEYEILSNKIDKQLKAENEGREIPSDAILGFSELKKVMQPLKPVYTGFKEEKRFDTMRMMYIKSSSFPLIPQVTKGTELDGLRRLLEKSGKNVRASYETANKVGSTTNAISPFNPDGTFNTELKPEDIERATMTLSRDNFRIQQDVPFKSGKRNEDTVSLGTQTLKLLFGDGILDINDFKLDGETISGKDLHEKFNTTYDNYINHKKQDLYDQLGLDSLGQPINNAETLTRLQEFLNKEAEDRGFPNQSIEGLSLRPVLKSNGEVERLEFNSPLWLSPDSNRYEALLNAIVTNRLVNIKLPGNSYVAGSEAGFKVTSDLSGINQSNIIYTSKFEGSLKAATIKAGSLSKTQVLLPSKFRDNKGELIEFIDKSGTPNPLYTYRDDSGMLRLKEDMIDEQLLSLTSFRIPTSSHVSMSQIEIVGILPTEVGDLMIVPKNLTKQKGLDFDIDKETTYQLHSYVDAEGRIKMLTPEAKQYLYKEATGNQLKKGDSLNNFLAAIFGEDVDFNAQEIQESELLSKLDRKLDQKLYENELVKIHGAVLSNPNEAVQRKINKVLSMDFAKSQAELVQDIVEGDIDNKYFSMLDDTFQKEKMFLGASGKLGIGVYSNYVVFHSMIQQSEDSIQLKTLDEEAQVPLEITIGNQTSFGKLGLSESLAPKKYKRSISEIFAERQNTATDNEKEQIMGRLNINEVTINVDSLLSALGFDKDVFKDSNGNDVVVSIPYLLLSQPILKEYVEEIRKTQSNINTYDPAAASKVVQALREKYNVEAEYDSARARAMLTGETLYNNLQKDKVQNLTQLTVLDLFLELETYANSVGKLQKRLNINNSGLGKSYFETIEKYQGLQNIPYVNENNTDGIIIANATKLIGDYQIADSKMTALRRQVLIAEGYLDFDSVLIKPNNPVGSMLVNAVHSGFHMWKDYFPYGDGNVQIALKEVLKLSTNESTSSNKIVEIQQRTFQEMKKFFVSSSRLGLFEGNPQQQRNRLFLDSDTNTSLSSYLNNLINLSKNEYSFLKANQLVSRFEYQVNSNGQPSLIRFDNTKGESFDEDYLYASLIELMEQSIPLPDFNGESYDTNKLAKDLVSYSYLEGGVQEAIQFVKYVPVSYLNTLTYGEFSRKWDNKKVPGIFRSLLGVTFDENKVSNFTRQYIQHNPQRLPKIDVKEQTYDAKYEGKSKDLINLTEFKIDSSKLNEVEFIDLMNSRFVSIYNPNIEKGYKKFQVYENNGTSFKRISTLGIFGMSEYSIRENDIISIVNPYHKVQAPQPSITLKKENAEDVFGLKTLTPQEIVNGLADYEFQKYGHLSPVAKALAAFVPNDLTFEIKDLTVKGKRAGRGYYLNNKITIDKSFFETASNEDLAQTLVHELVHATTFDYVDTYIDREGNYKVDNPPENIQNLVILFNEVRNTLGEELVPFMNKIEAQRRGENQEKNSERERTIIYGGTNVHEFLALVMTEPNFQEAMKDVKYKATNKDLLTRLVEIVNNIMKSVFGNEYNTNGVTFEGIRVSLEIAKSQYVSKKATPIQRMENSDQQAEKLLTGFGLAITPDEKDFDSLKKSGKFDPFNCK